MKPKTLTIRLAEDEHQQLKLLAVQRKTSVQSLVEAEIRGLLVRTGESLSGSERPEKATQNAPCERDTVSRSQIESQDDAEELLQERREEQEEAQKPKEPIVSLPKRAGALLPRGLSSPAVGVPSWRRELLEEVGPNPGGWGESRDRWKAKMDDAWERFGTIPEAKVLMEELSQRPR